MFTYLLMLTSSSHTLVISQSHLLYSSHKVVYYIIQVSRLAQSGTRPERGLRDTPTLPRNSTHGQNPVPVLHYLATPCLALPYLPLLLLLLLLPTICYCSVLYTLLTFLLLRSTDSFTLSFITTSL